MPIRLDQIPIEDQSTTDLIQGSLPSVPQIVSQQQAQSGQQPGLELQGVTVSGGKPSMRFGVPKQPVSAKQRAIPQGQLKAIEDTNKSITRLQGLIKDMQENKHKTGPLSPRFFRGNLGNVAMQYSKDAKGANFKAANERFINEYLTAQTGAQRGFKEIQWLSTAVPNPATDLPENYINKANSTLAELESNRNSMIQTLKDAGYNYEPKDKQKEDPLGLR